MRRFPGVAVGLVTSVDDPDGQGRIQLSFPWMEGEVRSHWVPVATPLAGKDRGQFFQPEVDDEALVAFEHGDFDHPFILGYLWNGVDTPPENTNKNRVIKTPGGHTLRFEDADGAKKIIIESDGGHNITLDDVAKTVTISGTGGANQVVIDTVAGNVRVQAAARVVVEAPQVELTDGGAHPLVFGDVLLAHLNQMAAQYQAHTHPGELALGIFPVTPAPPVPPLPAATPALISTRVRTG